MREVEVPEGVSVQVEGNRVRVRGPKGELVREFKLKFEDAEIKIGVEGQRVKIWIEGKERRKVKAMEGTVWAHIRNMITGVTKGYVYKLRAVYAHFPIQVKVLKDKKLVEIFNFLGEKTPRYARIVGDVSVEVKGREIIVKGINVEHVGQTAANIEQATRIRGKDRRIFQDGIYLVERGVGS